MKTYFLKLLYQILFTKIDEEPIAIRLSNISILGQFFWLKSKEVRFTQGGLQNQRIGLNKTLIPIWPLWVAMTNFKKNQ